MLAAKLLEGCTRLPSSSAAPPAQELWWEALGAGQGLRPEGSHGRGRAAGSPLLLARAAANRLCSPTPGSEVEALNPVVTGIEIGPL